MAANAAKAFEPRILCPYHTGDSTEVSRISELLKGVQGIEVRLRKMK